MGKLGHYPSGPPLSLRTTRWPPPPSWRSIPPPQLLPSDLFLALSSIARHATASVVRTLITAATDSP
jgi:hypothetical protein